MRKERTFAPSLAIALALAASLNLVEGAEHRLPRPIQIDPAIPTGQTDMPATLGPMPRLDPIGRFTPPIDPWEPAGIGWGMEGLDEEGVPLCLTNRHPTTTCDPEGPRPFLHAGVDARPAPDRVVRASAAGRVVVARRTTAPVTGLNPGEAGGIVVLEHDRDGDPATTDDHLLTIYGHVDPEVGVGAIVAQGERIALTSTQRGDHLHFGVRQGPFDPADRDVLRAYLPPAGTLGCAGCYSRPLPAPAFPDRWQDPEQLFAGPPFWLAIYGEPKDAGEPNDSAGDVIETDGGYLAFGYTWNQPGTPGRSMAVRRLDREGNIVSQRAYYAPGRDADAIKHVERTQDGGVIALAVSLSTSGAQVPMLVKFDAAGDPQWARQYGVEATPGFPPVRLWWEDIAVTADGGFVVTGTAQLTSTVNATVLVARLDAAGNVLWVKTYDPFLFHRGIDGKGIAPTADGGFVVVAEYTNPSAHFSVVKDLLVFHLDAEGGFLWGTNVGNIVNANDARAGQIEATLDGGSIVVGYRTVASFFLPSEIWVVKLNADGTVAWSSLYGSATGNGQLDEGGTRLVVTSDGGYVVGGHRTSFVLGPGGYEFDTDLVLMRLDGGGEIVEQRRLDSLGPRTTPLGLRATTDGFLLAGGMESNCRTCPFLTEEQAVRFVIAHLDANLDCPGGCTHPYDLVRQPHLAGTPVGFHVGAMTGTSVDRTLARVDTADRRYPCARSAFGAPPVFESASIGAVRQRDDCDRTEYIEAFACDAGVPGVQATSPVVLTVNYDSLRLTAHVVDGDSTPEQSDVVDVTATTDRPDSPVFPLLDDGSLTNLPDPYGFNTVTFCNEDPIAGVCRCGPRDVPAISYDIVMGDGIYTRDPSLTLPPLVVERDCIAENAHRTLFNFQPGIPLSVSLRATDRIGNVSETSATVTPSAATVSCSGDACGCCLLVNPDATACAGLPGLPSPDFPDGLCRAF